MSEQFPLQGRPIELAASNPFASELLPGETVRWTGQPDASRLFTAADLMLVPFSLMWGGFAIFWESMAIRSVSKQPASLFMALWGIPFVAVGLYMIVGRFFYRAWIRRRTNYAVTNRRVLIVTDGWRREVVSLDLNNLGPISKRRGARGAGTLIFGNAPPGATLMVDSGLEVLSRRSQMNVVGLVDIPEVDQVLQTIDAARRSVD